MEGPFPGPMKRVELDFAWEQGKITRLKVLSKAGGECRIRVGGNEVSITTLKGQIYELGQDFKL